jgi:hypothetical protein
MASVRIRAAWLHGEGLTNRIRATWFKGLHENDMVGGIVAAIVAMTWQWHGLLSYYGFVMAKVY